MATLHIDPDGTRRWKVSSDALEAAALAEEHELELTDEQFSQLTDEMRQAGEESDTEEGLNGAQA